MIAISWPRHTTTTVHGSILWVKPVTVSGSNVWSARSQSHRHPSPNAPAPPPPIAPSFNESMAEDTLLDILKSDGLGESKIVSRLAPSGQIKSEVAWLVRSLDENIADYYLFRPWTIAALSLGRDRCQAALATLIWHPRQASGE